VLVTATFFNLPFASTVVYLTGIPDYLTTYFGSHHIFYILSVPFGVLLLLASGVFLFSFQYHFSKIEIQGSVKESPATLKGLRPYKFVGDSLEVLCLRTSFSHSMSSLWAAAFHDSRGIARTPAVTVYLTASEVLEASLRAILFTFSSAPLRIIRLSAGYVDFCYIRKNKHGDVTQPYPDCTPPRGKTPRRHRSYRPHFSRASS
jgi:hypothetical protein